MACYVDCKTNLAQCVVEALFPLKERREILAENPKLVPEVLHEGKKRATLSAAETMTHVRKSIKP